MNTEQTIKQSKSAYAQWGKQWADHAKFHSKYPMKSFGQFQNIGIGRACLLVANGYSFEENIDTIKKHHKNVDIICCDKTLGHLIDNGIDPTYCMVCDANVNYEKYMKPWENKLQNTIMFQNVCGNPEWTKNGNWKDKIFYVNKDVMNYEREFAALSGCKNFLTAGTNVSNMMLVVLAQSENERRQNFFGYDKYILIGYDYSWKFDGGYYAFDWDANGKRHYMRHIYGLGISGKLIFSSNNLSNSASWFDKYVKVFKLPVVQCSKDSIYSFGSVGDLEEQIQYRHRPSDAKKVTDILKELKGIDEKKIRLQNGLRDIAKDHWFASQSV
jgi:hypothetical protein